jgi:hypothetical protein
MRIVVRALPQHRRSASIPAIEQIVMSTHRERSTATSSRLAPSGGINRASAAARSSVLPGSLMRSSPKNVAPLAVDGCAGSVHGEKPSDGDMPGFHGARGANRGDGRRGDAVRRPSPWLPEAASYRSPSCRWARPPEHRIVERAPSVIGSAPARCTGSDVSAASSSGFGLSS